MRFFLAFTLTATVGSTALAQKLPIKIDAGTRIGLPPVPGEQDDVGRTIPVVKINTWVPIYLKLQMGEKPAAGAGLTDAYLHVDGQDGDGLGLGYRLALGDLSGHAPGTTVEPGDFPSMPYVRPTGRGDLTLTVCSADGTHLSEPFRIAVRDADPAAFVVLSLGSKLPGFSLKSTTTKRETGPGVKKGLRDGRVVLAACIDPLELPDHWFGYAAADVVVLPTGESKLPVLDALFGGKSGEPKFQARREALFDWVRRGGKLIVSTGANADQIARYPLLQEFLVASVTPAEPKRSVARLILEAIQPSNLTPVFEPKRAADRFSVANLTVAPDRGAQVLLHAKPEQRVRRTEPAVVRWPYGLGKVTMVAFDLDRAPFVDDKLKDEMWDWLLRQAANPLTFLGDNARRAGNAFDGTSQEDKFVEALRSDAETFDGVPVISFGWVALFIVLYTLLIGPIEYMFLKRVLKRLELTWITFPLIVASVSAGAYFTAYAIKGRELRVNKVDVIDVDPVTQRVYGRTWASIFSPRIDYYSVGIGPNRGWVPAGDAQDQPEPLVDWTAGGTGGGETLWGGRYSYRVDAANHQFANGLTHMPIQVWSVKVVEANWEYRTGPLVESRLSHPPGVDDTFTGEFISRLPFGQCTNPDEPDPAKRTYALTDAVAIYRRKVYKLGTILPNVPVTILTLASEEDPQWLERNANIAAVTTITDKSGTADSPLFAGTGNVSLWGAMFHEFLVGKMNNTSLSNASLRPLDQSWRLDEKNLDEVIVLAKIGPVTGPAEVVFGQANSPTPTLLWLKGNPADGKPREPISGVLHQETYVRIFLPVKKTK
jgi:hypothetical protein